MNNFPGRMILQFAEAFPEEVRAMYIDLYDESQDTYDRIAAFKAKSDELLPKLGTGAAQHYQYESAITTYLWLRYPDKYTVYKYGEIKNVAEQLNSGYQQPPYGQQPQQPYYGQQPQQPNYQQPNYQQPQQPQYPPQQPQYPPQQPQYPPQQPQ